MIILIAIWTPVAPGIIPALSVSIQGAAAPLPPSLLLLSPVTSLPQAEGCPVIKRRHLTLRDVLNFALLFSHEAIGPKFYFATLAASSDTLPTLSSAALFVCGAFACCSLSALCPPRTRAVGESKRNYE